MPTPRKAGGPVDEDNGDIKRRMTGAERRETILHAARVSFLEAGDIGTTTTRGIAARAGVTEAMIYRHFESKDDLFKGAVIDELDRVLLAAVDRAAHLERTQSTGQEVETLAGFVAELIEMMDDVGPLLGLVLFGPPERAQDFYSKQIVPLVAKLEAATQPYLQSRHSEQLPVAEFVRSLLGIALMASIERRLGADPTPLDANARELAALLYHGVGAVPSDERHLGAGRAKTTRG